jgi:hypothetical protein
METRTFEALEAAIKFEEDGRTFFLAAGEKTEEKFGKSIFLSLADAELDHIQKDKNDLRFFKQSWEMAGGPLSLYDEAIYQEHL